MKYISMILLPIIIMIIAAIISSLNRKAEVTTKAVYEHRIIMTPPKYYMLLALGGLVLFPVLIILAFIFPADVEYDIFAILGMSLVFVIIYSLPVYLLFFYLNYKIIIYEDSFVYQNFWRIKKTISFNEIKIDRSKLNPRVMKKNKNGKYRTIFKLAGILSNEDLFLEFYKNSKKRKSIKV